MRLETLGEVDRKTLALKASAGVAVGVIVFALLAAAREDDPRGQQIVAQFARQLPLKVDEVTTLTNVAYEDGSIVYTAVVATDVAEADLPRLRTDAETGLKGALCSDAQVARFINGSGSVKYNYRFPRGNSMLVVIAEC